MRTIVLEHAAACVLIAVMTTPAPGGVDFETTIAPILERHCVECHGPDRQAGGLRLDTRDFAALGGISGLPVLGGAITTNEIYQRVSAPDADYRMPRFADPIAPDELLAIRRWVEAGTPWPANATVTTGVPPPSKLPPHLQPSRLRTWAWTFRHFIEPALPGVLFVAIAALVVERLRRRGVKLVASVRFSHSMLVIASLLAVHQLFRAGPLHAEVIEAQRITGGGDGHFGNPPVPRRPDHVRRLAGTYYRGNCERDERLFNGGNYRTCTFHLDLCDVTGRRLDAGAPVPPGGLFVRLDLERAPGTAEQLFSDKIMGSMFLSADVYTNTSRPPATAGTPIVSFEAVRPDWRWRARYPIGDAPRADGVVSGLVYFYRRSLRDTVPDEEIAAVAHYGLRYQIRIEDGVIADASDLWMGALFTTPVVATPPEPGKVPFHHWFDDRPIPVITEENTDDPVLLGLEEHVGGG